MTPRPASAGQDLLAERLARLGSLSNVELGVKVADIATEYERLLESARKLTDLVPVFADESVEVLVLSLPITPDHLLPRMRIV